ncbi:MAG TPA: 2-amino-4-hydroxy-6-hydroxymethyldihydropteridine diphosphokinase [Woeseiaceae bacterium]|nr:2-amino-4-hydroxy-6-hydroxymethyldihydropteridine diphosphokinase [Woeseiaceae bacterium]
MIRDPVRPVTAWVGLGSNLDEPVRQVKSAMRRLDGVEATRVIARSSLYRSAPLGPVEQPDFINAVVTVETRLAPRKLLDALQAIELEIGRQPAERWGPRRIDLDLLVYGDAVIDEQGLKIPHPGIAERNFVLLPLGEIAPDLVVPGLGRLAEIGSIPREPEISRIA